MKVLLCRDTITIKQTWDTRTLTYIIRELSTLLKEFGYEPTLGFAGSPVLGDDGLVVEIKLNRVLSERDHTALKKVLEGYASSVSTC